MTVILIVIGVLGTDIKRTGTGTGRFGNKRTSGDNRNYNIIKINLNTE